MHKLRPDDGEVAGLLALMLLTDARRRRPQRRRRRPHPAGRAGSRACGIRQAIAEGVALITAALGRGAVGPYQLQAAIAAVHDEAARAEDTDWPQILALYGLLERMSDNPMVMLNRAIAVAMVHGPRAGLELLDALDAGRAAGRDTTGWTPCAPTCWRWPATSRRPSPSYRPAASRTTSLPEQRYLMGRIARLNPGAAN